MWIEQHRQPRNKLGYPDPGCCGHLSRYSGSDALVLSKPRCLRAVYNVRGSRTKYCFLHIAWHDSSALTQGQTIWKWISVVLWIDNIKWHNTMNNTTKVILRVIRNFHLCSIWGYSKLFSETALGNIQRLARYYIYCPHNTYIAYTGCVTTLSLGTLLVWRINQFFSVMNEISSCLLKCQKHFFFFKITSS